MKQIIPFVIVENAIDAINFYKEVFGAKVIGNITYFENIPGMDKVVYEGKIGHSTLEIGSSRFFLRDDIDLRPAVFGDHVQFSLSFDTEEELKMVFSNLRKDGKVIDNLQEVFWGAIFGAIQDKFGVTWQLHCGHY